MADQQPAQPNQPAKPEPIEKDGEIVAKGEGARLPSQQLTLGQHVFIWAMIIIVGVLFGMGSTIPFMNPENQPRIVLGDVKESEALARQRVHHAIEEGIEGGINRQRDDDLKMFAEGILLARYAESLDLMPKGDTLRKLVDDELQQKTRSGRPLGDILADQQGRPGSVTRDQISRYLAEQSAQLALSTHSLLVPAVPRGAAALSARDQDLVEADTVEISADLLPSEVKDDDAELKTEFETLAREQPARVKLFPRARVDLALADPMALAKEIIIDEATIAAHYEANREQFRSPVRELAIGQLPPPTFQPLDSVRERIRHDLRLQRARTEAKRRIDLVEAEFAQDAQSNQDVRDPDGSRLAAAAAKAGVALHAGVWINHEGRELRFDGHPLNEIGSLDGVIQLLSKSAGEITEPMGTATAESRWVMLRLIETQAERQRSFEDLKPELKRIVAGRRAWADLRAKAEALAKRAGELGAGGLAKAIAEEPFATLKLAVKPQTYPTSNVVILPHSGDKPQAGERRYPSELLRSGHPALVIWMNDSGPTRKDVPVLMVLQARRLLTGEVGDNEALAARVHRRYATRSRAMMFRNRDLSEKLER